MCQETGTKTKPFLLPHHGDHRSRQQDPVQPFQVLLTLTHSISCPSQRTLQQRTYNATCSPPEQVRSKSPFVGLSLGGNCSLAGTLCLQPQDSRSMLDHQACGGCGSPRPVEVLTPSIFSTFLLHTT